MTADSTPPQQWKTSRRQPNVDLARQNLYQWLSRLGYASRGAVYLVTGWLALALSLGWGGDIADSKDAIRYLADMDSAGIIAMCLLIGLGAFSCWRFFQAAFDPDRHGIGPKGVFVRTGLALSGTIYLSLALFVAKIHFDLGLPWDSGDRSYAEWAALLLSQPAGKWLVGTICLVTIAAAIAHYVKAVRKTFLRYMDLDDDLRTAVVVVSRIGLIARGSILAMIGWYFGRVFVSLNPAHAIDQAGVLTVLQDQSMGTPLLLAAAVGLIAFGVYAVIEAAFRRIDLDR